MKARGNTAQNFGKGKCIDEFATETNYGEAIRLPIDTKESLMAGSTNIRRWKSNVKEVHRANPESYRIERGSMKQNHSKRNKLVVYLFTYITLRAIHKEVVESIASREIILNSGNKGETVLESFWNTGKCNDLCRRQNCEAGANGRLDFRFVVGV